MIFPKLGPYPWTLNLDHVLRIFLPPRVVCLWRCLWPRAHGRRVLWSLAHPGHPDVFIVQVSVFSWRQEKLVSTVGSRAVSKPGIQPAACPVRWHPLPPVLSGKGPPLWGRGLCRRGTLGPYYPRTLCTSRIGHFCPADSKQGPVFAHLEPEPPIVFVGETIKNSLTSNSFRHIF